MMKKNGFTLAEVLITLSIIGVIATLTLPTLMTNIGEQQYITGLKKGMNTLAEAAQLNKVMVGFDYADLSATTESVSEDTYSLYSLLGLRTNMDRAKSGTSATMPNMGAGNTVIYFNDGSALIYTAGDTDDSEVKATDDDGVAHGFAAVYDVNGDKGPNLLSNCSGTSATVDTASFTQCEAAKSNRFIKDRFSIRLRGTAVTPNGGASRWAMNH